MKCRKNGKHKEEMCSFKGREPGVVRNLICFFFNVRKGYKSLFILGYFGIFF